jgi:hypothetical protein
MAKLDAQMQGSIGDTFDHKLDPADVAGIKLSRLSQIWEGGWAGGWEADRQGGRQGGREWGTAIYIYLDRQTDLFLSLRQPVIQLFVT